MVTDPEKYVKEKGLVQISDEGQLREIVHQVLDENEQSVEDYKDGKGRALRLLSWTSNESNERTSKPTNGK